MCTGLEKSWVPVCALDKQVLVWSLFKLVSSWSVWAFAHQASENEQFLARQENLHFTADSQMVVFLKLCTSSVTTHALTLALMAITRVLL